MLGEMHQQTSRQQRHVACRTDMVLMVQAVGIDEIGLAHPQHPRRLVHLRGERWHGARKTFRDRHRHVVGRFDHDDFKRVLERDFGAGREAHF